MTLAVMFPGQGAQRKGMCRSLFDRFEDLVATADEILGYSVKKLCLSDPDNQLGLTQYTQPALFTVNAMAWAEAREEGMPEPAFLAGHSLGEYNALTASGSIDFATGLALVKKRGELMAAARNGGMAAVMNLSPDRIRDILGDKGFDKVEVANLNTPVQTVISGDREQIEAAKPEFESHDKARCLILKVSGAFHAAPMRDAADEFRSFMAGFEFKSPGIPVISNTTAGPYPRDDPGAVSDLLCRQMISPVRWMDSVRYMQASGTEDFREVGPGRVLTKMLKSIFEG